MRQKGITQTLEAPTRLWLFAAYAIAAVALPSVNVTAQSNTITQEKVIIRETVPAPETVVRQSPPPPREEVRITAPSSHHVWVPGYWTWGNSEWVWVYGRWEKPPERMATWVPGQWVQRGDMWAWRQGHWE